MYQSTNGSDCAKEALDLNIKTIDENFEAVETSQDATASGDNAAGDWKLSNDQLHDAEQQGAHKAVLQYELYLHAPLTEKPLPSTCDFSHKAVNCLIKAVQCRMSQYMKGERSQFFHNVQEEMAKKGHFYPAEKIRRKWNNLIVTYKRAKDRSLDKGNTKTLWEFFDLMDATVGATIGAEIVSQRNKRRSAASLSLAVPLGKLTKKSSQQPAIIIHPNGTITPVPQVAASAQGANVFRSDGSTTSLPGAAMASGSSDTDLMPLLFVREGLVNNSVHQARVSPCMSSAASLRPVNTQSPSPAQSEEGEPPRYINIKGPSGMIRARLANAQGSPQSLASLPSLPLTPPAAGPSRTEGQPQVGGEVEGERVARRRAEARAKRRQRREARMVECLGRIATAMDLLSSKQDTVIALLQRIADHK